MVWTTPRTWITGEVLSSSNFNTHIRDNLIYLKGGGGSPVVIDAAAMTVNGQPMRRIDFGSASPTVAAGFGDTLWTTISFAAAFAVAPMVLMNGYLSSGPGSQPLRPGTISTTAFQVFGPGAGNNPAAGTVYWIAVGVTG